MERFPRLKVLYNLKKNMQRTNTALHIKVNTVWHRNR